MKTIKIRAPIDVVHELRSKYPGVRDADLFRMIYNTSLMKGEMVLAKKDFSNNLGKFIYGAAWKK